MSDYVHLCLSDLLDQDLSSYEYFYSLPTNYQAQLKQREISTFEELQDHTARIRQSGIFSS